MSRKRRRGPGGDLSSRVSFPEVMNPAMPESLRRTESNRDFEGDEHGHETHDVVPAEEDSSVEDELRPGLVKRPGKD